MSVPAEPRIFRVRQTRTGRWVGEVEHGEKWIALSGGQDYEDTRENVIDDMCRRRGQRVRFAGEETIYGD